MRCRAGDLAVVIAATNECNIGRIVRVLRFHDNATDVTWHMRVPCWEVECATHLTWGSIDTIWIHRRVGPAPDAQLQPIRGLPSGLADYRVHGETPGGASTHQRMKDKENTMITLERAIALASEAHAGQVDKAGVPYILHPLRVMLAQSTIEAKIVAVMHDVVEDCAGWGFDRLAAEGFTPDMIAALRSVTKVEGEEYEDFVRRAAANPIGRAVKLADLRDNLDISRIAQLTEKDRNRVNKYKRALALLEGEPPTYESTSTLENPKHKAVREAMERMDGKLPPLPKQVSFQEILKANEAREIAEGKHSPKMGWPEE